MVNPPQGFNGSVFNARQAITSEASYHVIRLFKNSESKHIAICGSGASKDALLASLGPKLKSKTVKLTLSSTGKAAFQEAVRTITAQDPFCEANSSLQEWLDALGHPYSHHALTGRAQVCFALESQLARIVLIGEWCDFKKTLQGADVELVSISALDPNADAFRDLGGIGALLYSGVTEEHILEMMK